MSQTIDGVFRDHKTAGVPTSGEHEPRKPEIRALLKQIQNSGGMSVTRNTSTALLGVTPPTENYMGVVLDDPDATKNGYYSRVAGVWTWERGFPETAARLVGVAGSGNAPTASTAPGVDPGQAVMLFFTPRYRNTGAMTLSVNGAAAKPLLTFDGLPMEEDFLTADATIPVYDNGTEYRLLWDHRWQTLAEQTRSDRDVTFAARDETQQIASQAQMDIASARAGALTAVGELVDEAEAAKDVAQGYASDIVSQGAVPLYTTHVGLPDVSIPAGLQSGMLWGYARNSDGGQKTIRRVDSEPGHPAKVRSADRFTRSGGSTPDTTNGGWWEFADANLNALQFGAHPDNSPSANRIALQNAATWLPSRQRLTLPDIGIFQIDRPLTFYGAFAALDFAGMLQASDDFVGDYMVELIWSKASDYYTWPVDLNLNLDCRFKTRGVRSYRADHNDWRGVRVERPYGQGIKIDRWRESVIYMPRIINGAARQAFADPTDWSAATAYTAGMRARVVDPAWDSATFYNTGAIIRRNGNRYIAARSGTNFDPATATAYWAKIPHEDYQCVDPTTNQNPQTFNMNNNTPANRKWQKVYQDEAAIEINDTTIDTADRTNQVTLISPIVRDSGHKCFLRIDNNKNAVPITHVNILHGHLHNTFASQVAYPEVFSSDLQRVIEIGHCININIHGTNMRMVDGPNNIGLLIGDGGTTKNAKTTTVHGVFSGEAAGQRGVIVMPSVISGGGKSRLLVEFLLTTDFTNIIDPNRYFRFELDNELRVDVPPGLASTPVGFGAFFDDLYSLSSLLEGRFASDSNPRIRLQMTTSKSALQLGDGSTAPDIELARSTANRLDLAVDDNFRMGAGTAAFQLVAPGGAVFYLWVDDAGKLKIHPSAPGANKNTIGTVVGTQT